MKIIITWDLEVLNLLQELNKKHNTTIIMVIHELNNAEIIEDHRSKNPVCITCDMVG